MNDYNSICVILLPKSKNAIKIQMQKNFLFWAWKINILGLYIRKGV